MTETEALHSVLKAWEALPQGRHTPRQVETWMREHMWHAANDAREALGMERTDRDAHGNPREVR